MVLGIRIFISYVGDYLEVLLVLYFTIAEWNFSLLL